MAGLALVGVLFLVLAYQVAPIAGAALPRLQLPSVLLSGADREFVEAEFDVTPIVSANALKAARQAPLEAAPFYYAALTLDEENDREKIAALLAETLKRDPRHYYARLWRARIYYNTKQIPAAIDDVLTVLALDPSHANEYVGALVDLARDPGSHALLLRLVAEQSHWADDFIRSANESLGDEEFLVALASRSPTALNDYVRVLATNGEFERAFLIWQSRLSEDELLAFSWPFDPNFDVGEAASTFGWTTNIDVATREENGLYVFYNGRGEKLVASQTTLLGTDYAYTLAVSMSGESDARGGSFRWTLRCRESGHIAGEFSVSDITPETEVFSGDALVPAEGCGVQVLSVTARAGEYVLPSRVTIHNVTIRERAKAAPTEVQAMRKPVPASAAGR